MDFPPRDGSRRRSEKTEPVDLEMRPDPDAGVEEGPLDAEATAAGEDQVAPSGGRPERDTESAFRRLGGSETLARLAWAIPAIALAITVIVLGGEIFAATMLMFAALGMGELFRMVPRLRPFPLVAYGAAAGMIVAALYGDSFHIVLAGVAFFPVMLIQVARRPSLDGATVSMAVTVFAILWIALPFAHAVLFRELPVHGAALLVDVLVATFLTDTFAYLGGRWFGQRPLAPTISPNKTVEGLMIGIAGGTFGFWLAGLYQDWLSGTDALLMGACIAVLAPAGDLFESAVKRDLDVKDTGTVFGPHGGVLDRLDAVLFTVVAGYYLSLLIVL